MTDPKLTGVELPPAELVRKFDVPAPRYTSYPTADRFVAGFPAAAYEAALARHGASPLSVYVHVPFCSDICYYCGCNKIVTRDYDRVARYIEAVLAEARMVSERLAGTRSAVQFHFGGGSPTYLTTESFTTLFEGLKAFFPLEAGGEFSFEADPRNCPPEKIAALRTLGFNRISFGVQDFNGEVQKAVNRIQPFEMVEKAVQACRGAGYDSVNIDLIYGLPRQTRDSFVKTVRQVLDISPDRIALYHYAHLPSHFPAQRRILDADLPDTETKVSIMMDAIEVLTANGYRYIGMDHFAKLDDELSVAQLAGRIQRNFQGYSTLPDCDMVALGVSAISNVSHVYACNPRDIESYYEAVEAGRLATSRGYELNEDDVVRAAAIQEVMCQFAIDKAAFAARFGIDFDAYFDFEIRKLAAYEKVGFVEITPGAITVSPKGKIFVRAIAMQFDRHLRESSRAGGYSKIA